MTNSPAASNELTQHPVWSQLTLRQQSFCLEFAVSGDAVEAVKKTHKVTTQKSAEAVAGRIVRNWKVRRVLGSVGVTLDGVLVSKTEALQLTSDKLRDLKTDTASFVKLLTIYERLSGWVEKPKSTEKSEDDFDQVLALEQSRKHG